MSLLNFCDNCENNMILKIKNQDQTQVIEYHCNNCGNIKDNITQKCIIKNDYNLQQLYIQEKNIKYIAHDASNPRLNNIACPNKECTSHLDNKYDIVYISINEEDMKYLYYCVVCSNSWTNN